MPQEKKLTRSSEVADEIKKNRAIASAKTQIKASGLGDLERVKRVIAGVRELFPDVDKYLTPGEILGQLGINLGAVANCGYCLSCNLCENCNSCQTCNKCEQCQTCNTCQKQRGEDTCTIERPSVGGSILVDPAELVKLELVQLIKALSSHISAV